MIQCLGMSTLIPNSFLLKSVGKISQKLILCAWRAVYRNNRKCSALNVVFNVFFLSQVTSGFELYAVFGPLVTKPVAINSVNKLLKWVKKEEDRLFIMSSPTF